MPTRVLTGLTLLALVGCAGRTDADAVPTNADTQPAVASPRCDAQTPPPVAEVSPGGTPEVAVEAFAAARCNVRVIDVRTKGELQETGVIAGSEHLPLEHVANHAMGWDREDPVVFVCRSGRRSGAAAKELTEMGFTNVSSLTGGVLAWSESGRELAAYEYHREDPVPAARRQDLTVEDIRAHVADRDSVRMAKAATLLLHGTQACVDGRDAHAIIGTPGGDAGELVLALAAAEQLGRRPFSAEAVDQVFADYLEAFGHFYMHTDEHAAHRWLEHAGVAFDGAEDVAALLSEPPVAMRSRLLASAADPKHIGCGHLRLSVQFAEDYGVRPGLVRDVMNAYFKRLWAGDERLEFVVLAGDHAESGILQIEMGQKVHAFSQVPLVSPRVGDTEVFVVHPEVSAFIREQNAAFLLEAVPSLMSAGVGELEFLSAQQALAQTQLSETIRHLAPDLPVFVVKVQGGDITVQSATARDPQPPSRSPESGAQRH